MAPRKKAEPIKYNRGIRIRIPVGEDVFHKKSKPPAFTGGLDMITMFYNLYHNTKVVKVVHDGDVLAHTHICSANRIAQAAKLVDAKGTVVDTGIIYSGTGWLGHTWQYMFISKTSAQLHGRPAAKSAYPSKEAYVLTRNLIRQNDRMLRKSKRK